MIVLTSITNLIFQLSKIMDDNILVLNLKKRLISPKLEKTSNKIKRFFFLFKFWDKNKMMRFEH